MSWRGWFEESLYIGPAPRPVSTWGMYRQVLYFLSLVALLVVAITCSGDAVLLGGQQ